jgi:hypothetical protein
MTPLQMGRSDIAIGGIGSLMSLTHLDLKVPYHQSLGCVSDLILLENLSLYIADQHDNSTYVPVIGSQKQLTCIQLSVDAERGWGYLQQVPSFLHYSPLPNPLHVKGS